MRSESDEGGYSYQLIDKELIKELDQSKQEANGGPSLSFT